MSLILGLDLGGSSIKAGAVDAATGQLVGETQSAPTPAGAPVAATRDAIVVIQARLATVDRSLEEAAMDLGARPWKVFAVITLPLIAPAIASAWVLSFILSWDDIVITSFVSGPGSTTLPQYVFSKVRLGVSPDINALATILVLIVSIAVIVVGTYMMRRDQRRIRDAQVALGAGG